MKTMILSLLALCMNITMLRAQWEKTSGLTASAIHALTIDPESPGTIYAGTERGVYVSKNNGESWAMMNTGLKYSDVWSIAAGAGKLFAGTYENLSSGLPSGDVSFSLDGGLHWTSIKNGLAARGAGHLIPCSSGFLAATANGVFRTTDNGGNWTPVLSTPKKEFRCIASSSAGIFAGSHGDGVYRSRDEGTTWDNMNVDKKCMAIDAVACSGNVVYVAAYNTVTFEKPEPGVLMRMETHSVLFRSTDGGERWSEIPIPPKPRICGLYAIGDTLISAYFSSDPAMGGITKHTLHFKSQSEMESSVQVNAPKPAPATPADIEADAVVGPAGVHITTDGGKSWTVVNDGLSVTGITTITVLDGYVFAGTHIAGLYSRPLSELVAAARAGGDMKGK